MQCDRNFKIDQGLTIHIGKAHKSEDEPKNLRENGEDKTLDLSLPTDDRENILTLRNFAMSNVILSSKIKLIL